MATRDTQRSSKSLLRGPGVRLSKVATVNERDENTTEVHSPLQQAMPNSLKLATEAHQRYLIRTTGEDLSEAINYYIDTIKAHPEISQTYYRLATLLYETGQIGLDSAIEQCQQAVKIDAKNADAHIYLGYHLALGGYYFESKEHFKIAIRLKPFSSARTRIIMALTLLEKTNNFSKSNIFQALYCMFSGSLLFLIDKASIKMCLKNIKDDLSFWKSRTIGNMLEGFKKDKKAYEFYHRVVDNTKNSPHFYGKMAKIAAKEHQDEIALHCLENAMKLSNNEPGKVVSLIEFLEEKFPNKVDDLIDAYNLLTHQNPEFSRSYYELGHLYLKKNEKFAALNAFKLALEHDNNNPFYLNSLAFSCVQLEQYDEAVFYYKKAFELNPDKEWSAIVAQALATIYHQVQGNSELAILTLSAALPLTENKATIHQAIADIHYDSNNLDEATNHYENALKYDDKNSRAYSRLAMAYWEKDLVEKAILNYTKAIDLDPNYDIAYNNLGVIFLDGLGDTKRAMTYFETAVDINDCYVLAHFNLARAHDALGEKICAANEYQKAFDLNRKNVEMDEGIIQERLFQLFDT